MNFIDNTDTICAIATGNSIGAIAVIRLSGKNAFKITQKSFKGCNLEKALSHTVHFGTFRNDSNEIIDEVLVTLFHGPKSYTGENTVEISCHGSTYIQQKILQELIKNGARQAGAGEFTFRAFQNKKLDLSQAEAVADLISSESAGAHEMAIKQLRGGFSNEINELRKELIHFASLIELELDFGEEDVEFANRDDLVQLIQRIQTNTQKLIDSFDYGNAIKNGIPIAIIGKPNAGKSTLLNAIINDDRAIVSNIAGTTRDTIEETFTIQGKTFRFIDTAGIRNTTDEIEKIGVAKAFEEINKSSLFIHLFDASKDSINDIENIVSEIDEDIPFIHVANKIDCLTSDKKAEISSLSPTPILISAKEKEGIEQLKEGLFAHFQKHAIANKDNTVVSNVRHFEALTHANESLERVLHGIDQNITGDFLAMDIRHSLHHLGLITGAISTDDLLDNIFRNFCIGK